MCRNVIFVLAFIVGITHYASARIVKTTSECTPEEHWVSPHNRDRNGKLEFVTGHCRTNPNGYKFWSQKITNARPKGWPYKKERTKSWKVNEKEDVICALATLPEALWLKNLKGIYRMEKSKDYPNPASSGERHIVLYNEAFTSSKTPLNRVLVHELAHENYRALSDADRNAYHMSTNWYEIKDKGWIQRKEGYVRESGKVFPTEDFANNVEYFLFEPEKLKVTTPHAYTWIKNYFGVNFEVKEVACGN